MDAERLCFTIDQNVLA